MNDVLLKEAHLFVEKLNEATICRVLHPPPCDICKKTSAITLEVNGNTIDTCLQDLPFAISMAKEIAIRQAIRRNGIFNINIRTNSLVEDFIRPGF